MDRRTRPVAIWTGAIGSIALVTAAGNAIGLNPSTIGFAYLIVVLLISLWGGLLAGTISSVLATLCYNFFFFPPLYTFTIENPANWFALAAFLVASVTVNRLVVAARVQAEKAEQRRTELETLYGLSIDLFTATNRVGALGEAAGRALKLLGAQAGGLVLFDGSPFRQNVVSWNGDKPDEIEDLIAGVGRHKEPLEFPSPLGRDVYLPLIVGGKTTGTLVARGTEASRQALESAARLVAMAVERERFIEENAHVQALRESEALKTSLLRAISHDLTTPITAITIRTESIRRRAGTDDELREDAGAIAEETARLRRRIDNLLAMARLEAGKAKPRIEPTPPADLFRATRENLPIVFSARPITVHVEPDCPDANVDPSLALEILVNLVENAHRVSPASATIELVARKHPLDAGKVRIEILDRGPGLPPGVVDADGNVATETTDVAQRGLGLEIARSLAAANGGSIGLAPRPGGGTIARIDLPAALLPEEVSS
ncbi:MAG: two-component system, OmpR family, sensor histidine kinase KdpD [Thermoanaerobaculia bacterium]|jgi:two-component system sensor histidine kinase KdpD|nr:two-component system, OmpR family, sensor histidine kinase KdpD [Thermoanaerobaculia bacterium]